MVWLKVHFNISFYFKFGLLYPFLFSQFSLFTSLPSHAESFSAAQELSGLVYKYIPSKVLWHDFDVYGLDGVEYLRAGTIVIKAVKCEHHSVPVRVIYKSGKLKDSYSGYFIVDPNLNKSIYIKVLQFKVSADVLDFSHLEIDEDFSECFSEAFSEKYIASPYFYKINRKLSDKSAYVSQKIHRVDTILFDDVYSSNFKLARKSVYKFKGLVAPLSENGVKNNWYSVCDPRALGSYFEKAVLGRAVVCGITDSIASVNRLPLERGESIQFSGSVFAGSAFLVIHKVGGGVVKVSVLNRGKYSDTYRATSSGTYSITLLSNMSVYNYPYLNFDFFMRRLSVIKDINVRP